MYRKYNNKKTKLDGHTFDSKRESERYKELKKWKKDGEIRNLVLQPRFPILESFELRGTKMHGVTYIADFLYFDIRKDIYIVEDVKGLKTDLYTVKMKFFLSQRLVNNELAFEIGDNGSDELYNKLFTFIEI
jgi:hypothetical protein